MAAEKVVLAFDNAELIFNQLIILDRLTNFVLKKDIHQIKNCTTILQSLRNILLKEKPKTL